MCNGRDGGTMDQGESVVAQGLVERAGLLHE